MSSSAKGLRYIKDVLEYSNEILKKKDLSNLDTKDILGFRSPKGVNAFLPYIKCVPVTALFPIYDTLIVGIRKVKKIDALKIEIGLSFNEIVQLAQKEKIVLFLDVDCFLCLEEMAPVIQQLVDNNVPFFLGGSQADLLALKAAEPVGIDFDAGYKLVKDFSAIIETERDKKLRETLRAMVQKAGKDPSQVEITSSTSPVRICSMITPTSKYVRQLIDVGKIGQSREEVLALASKLYMAPMFFLAKAFGSTLSTNVGCKYMSQEKVTGKVLPDQPLPDFLDPFELEFIEKKLRIAYSDNIPLTEYIELFDSNTTEAIRKLLRKIILDAHTKSTSVIALQNTLNEYNQQVDELINRSTRKAKIVFATSDIVKSNIGAIRMVIEGVAKKYLNTPEKAWDCMVVPEKYRNSMSKWLGNKAVRLESLLTGVAPDVIHLYHVRTCLEKATLRPKVDLCTDSEQ